MKNKEYALVLAGGGAKGSYQIGVWKALRKIGININAVFGTSVGAINSALILSGDFNYSLNLWKEMTLDKIVEIPKEFVKNGSFYFDFKNLDSFFKLQKILISEKGFNTAPLKRILEKVLDEKKIRGSNIDFGLVTYDINSYKPEELYIEDIPEGFLLDYILASSSIPFLFKSVKVKDKQLIDGGVYNNIPFNVAKDRGYKNIIVVDITGLGVNKKIEIEGINLIYIKNSIDMGNILDFSKEFLLDFIELGYLDTLKTFGEIDGINYFYKNNFKTIGKLEKILTDKSIAEETGKIFTGDKNQKKETNVVQNIKKILPDKLRYNKSLIISLAECAAMSLNFERKIYYGSFDGFIKNIWKKYNELENKKDGNKINLFEGLNKLDIGKNNLQNFLKSLSGESENILKKIFGGENKTFETNLLNGFFPYLKPAKVFFILLKYYFKRKKYRFFSNFGN